MTPSPVAPRLNTAGIPLTCSHFSLTVLTPQRSKGLKPCTGARAGAPTQTCDHFALVHRLGAKIPLQSQSGGSPDGPNHRQPEGAFNLI